MDDLEAEIARARGLDVAALADAIEAIGFECTRCGACCRGHGDEHTATVFPDEVRDIEGAADPGTPDGYDWRDVARPMPFGLAVGEDGEPAGETFEWALQTDDCGDCRFYEPGEEPRGVERLDGARPGNESPDAAGGADGSAGTCTVYGDRPRICRTYPFSVATGGSEPMGDVVDAVGPVRAHECEGLGKDISRADATDLARTLKERAVREVEELLAVREAYEPVDPAPGEVVVHDSEGAKSPDGTSYR